MVQVVATTEFKAWISGLPSAQQEAVAHLVRLLREFGVTLDHPYSSRIHGSKVGLRELRVNLAAIRILYVFDPERRAVLLLGGSKAGDKKFYERMTRTAEAIYRRHLAAMER